jgi:hypothetical protein
MARAESKQERAHFDEKLAKEGWEEAAHAAAYVCQCRTLKLRPWQAPPVHVHGAEIANVYGCQPEEVALKQRMIALGISVFEPDPIGALERQVESA